MSTYFKTNEKLCREPTKSELNGHMVLFKYTFPDNWKLEFSVTVYTDKIFLKTSHFFWPNYLLEYWRGGLLLLGETT